MVSGASPFLSVLLYQFISSLTAGPHTLSQEFFQESPWTKTGIYTEQQFTLHQKLSPPDIIDSYLISTAVRKQDFFGAVLSYKGHCPFRLRKNIRT